MPPSLTASVFVGISVDGFLARPDHGLDFLPPDGGEAHGYTEFLATVDAIVLGRNTYDKVLTFGEWPYGRLPVIVLSSRPLDPPADPDAVVERQAGEPAALVAALAARGFRHLYVDGGLTIQGFLRAGLIQRLVLTRVPVLIGRGIPLFGPLARDLPLRHVATRSYASGLVQSEYRIDP
jgi:dihydrofolate reductase